MYTWYTDFQPKSHRGFIIVKKYARHMVKKVYINNCIFDTNYSHNNTSYGIGNIDNKYSLFIFSYTNYISQHT